MTADEGPLPGPPPFAQLLTGEGNIRTAGSNPETRAVLREVSSTGEGNVRTAGSTVPLPRGRFRPRGRVREGASRIPFGGFASP
jgi:hypothetical protein